MAAVSRYARMPALFVSTGGPNYALHRGWLGQLQAWSAKLSRPAAILAFSAHWEYRPIAIGATTTVPLIYDFSGFPPHYYDVRYPAPGAPALAARLRELLLSANQPYVEDPQRGLDHGVYPALLGLYPRADVPVLLLSMPSENPGELLALGRLLSPLRDEGVLILSTGYPIHNLQLLFGSLPQPRAGENFDSLIARAHANPEPVAPWARAFDSWLEDVLVRKDWNTLLNFNSVAPGAREALPSDEHFVTLIIAAGAARSDDPVSFPISGFDIGSATLRSVQFG